MDVRDLLSEHGVPFVQQGEHHHASANFVNADCPFCSPRSLHYRLGFSLTTGVCNCWTCGRHDAAEALSLLTGASVALCRSSVRDMSFLPDTQHRHAGRYQEPDGVERMKAPHREYLRSRGLDPNTIETLWGVRGIGLVGQLRWRIFVPIHLRGEPVAWTTRKMTAGGRRYHTSTPEQSAVLPSELLYGVDYCRHSVVVVEGVVDVWAVGPGCVATMGTRCGTMQLAQLARFPRRTVCFDSEPVAQGRARRLAGDLSVFPGETNVVQLETGKDAAEASPAEVEELRERYVR